MKNIPEISVIMSVYNGEKYLAGAIDSICAQSFKNWELIVINDCSSDRTSQVLREYASSEQRIRVFDNETNMKLPASLNKAIELSRGRYIARMDADDIALPQRLEKQLDFMKNNPDTMISSCRYMTLKGTKVSSGGGGGRCDFEAVKALLLVTNPVLHPGVIAKSEVLKALKYDTSRTCTEDLDIWVRAANENMEILIQDEYLMLYRIHEKQITFTTFEKQKEEVLSIQGKYNGVFFENLSDELKKFYIDGIYFRQSPDAELFCRFYRAVLKVCKDRKVLHESAAKYALFEILAEYRRCGVPPIDILKCLKCFGPFFLTAEFLRRKKAARRDGRACIRSAEKAGLKFDGNSIEFPAFSGFERMIK